MSTIEDAPEIEQPASEHVVEQAVVDGEPVGATLFINSDELREMGVDPTQTRVTFTIEHGSIRAE